MSYHLALQTQQTTQGCTLLECQLQLMYWALQEDGSAQEEDACTWVELTNRQREACADVYEVFFVPSLGHMEGPLLHAACLNASLSRAAVDVLDQALDAFGITCNVKLPTLVRSRLCCLVLSGAAAMVSDEWTTQLEELDCSCGISKTNFEAIVARLANSKVM